MMVPLRIGLSAFPYPITIGSVSTRGVCLIVQFKDAPPSAGPEARKGDGISCERTYTLLNYSLYEMYVTSPCVAHVP
ncbi:hypothetical protein Gbfr_015_013 [Gluconobacter frateurii M-2]|nr:hypothetical protein Gbfr_015_013 [Gluconobacter frateurii M-2]